MGDWRTILAAATGQSTSRELEAARRGVDRATLREVRRSVRRGEAAPDVPRARLAVAIAHEVDRGARVTGSWVRVVLVALMVLWTTLLVLQAVRGELGLASVPYATATVAFAGLLVLVPRRVARARRAEEANRRVLEAAGESVDAPPEQRGVAEVRGPRLVLAAAVALVVYTALFGLLSTAIGGEQITVLGVLARGAFFGIFMTAFNLIIVRRRTRRPRG